MPARLETTPLLLLCMLCQQFDTSYSQTDTDARNLRQQLFVTNAYDTRIRPVSTQSDPIRIFVDLNLLALNEVNTVRETLRLTAYLRLKWGDAFLTWDSKDYGGLTFYHWPQDEVWKPVIALRNSYLDYKALGDETLDILNYSDGGMVWMPFQVFSSTCSMDVTYYPFDTQTCNIQFVAWGYSKTEVEMAGGDQGIVTSEYETNPQWELLDSSWEVVSGATDVTITFTMTLKRVPNYVIFTVLLPVLLLTLLNIFVFILPCESGERVGYAVTVFLSFAVFFTLISGVLPESVAIFTIYVIVMTAQSALICLIAIVQVRFSTKDESEHPVPKWLGRLSYLGNCKCFRSSKTSSRNITPVKTFQIPEKDLQSEEMNTEYSDKDSTEDNSEETWKHAITGLDNILAVFFTVLSLLVTASSIGVCATA